MPCATPTYFVVALAEEVAIEEVELSMPERVSDLVSSQWTMLNLEKRKWTGMIKFVHEA